MTDRSSKARALARIDADDARWAEIIAAAEGRLDVPGVTEQWSLKDVIAHLNGWRLNGLAKLEAAHRGDANLSPLWPSDLTTDDEINEWIYQQNKDRPAPDVLADRDTASLRLRALVQALPEAELADASRFPTLDGQALGEMIASGGFFGHFHDEHEADIQRWLEAGHLHHP